MPEPRQSAGRSWQQYRHRVLSLIRVLVVASRPDQLLLIAGVYLFGITIALGYGAELSWVPVICGLLPLMAIAASVHYANEFADYETDAITNRTPFSGGSGILHREEVSRQVALWAGLGILVIGLSFLIGLFVVGILPMQTVVTLSIIAVLGWQYSVRPLKLAWRGWGELTNAVLGGLVLPIYGASVVGGRLALVVIACVPFFLLVLLNLFATQWPDRKADATVGKRTLAVQWPAPRLRRGYAGIALLAAGSVLILGLTIVPIEVAVTSLLVAPLVVLGALGYTKRQTPWPSVSAMVGLLIVQFAGWLWVIV